MLGDVYRKLGRMDKSRSLLEQGIELERQAMASELEREGALKAGHRALSVASAYDRMAKWHNDMKDYPPMVPLYTQALEVLKKHCDDRERQITIMTANLAVSLNRVGRAEEAQQAMQAVWDRHNRYPDHLGPHNLASLYRNEGEFSRQRGDLPSADASFRKADELFRTPNARGVTATDGESYALLLLMRARLAVDQNRPQEASEHIEHCLRIKRTLHQGDDHLSLADPLEFQSSLLASQDRHTEAADTALNALNLREKHMSPERTTLELLIANGEATVRLLESADRSSDAADLRGRIARWRRALSSAAAKR